MNDSRDLKAIAEACQQHQPLRFMRSHGALYIRNDNGIVFDVHQNRSFPEFMAQNKDYADLVLAANPATVLALIAENERLKTLRSTTERDLAQELEVWRRGPSCWNCGDTGDVHDMVGEWRGQCDCNAAKLIDVSSERDQLKAENEIFEEGMRSLACSLSAGGYNATTLDATQLVEKVQWGVDRLADTSGHLADQLRAEIAGLKTGYEAYERVNAELKAENEALKKRIDDMSPFKGAPLTGPDLKCLACGGYHYGLQGLPCPNMRITASAALGQGERS